MGTFVAYVTPEGRGLLTGAVTPTRAAEIVAERPGAWVITAPERAGAFRLAAESPAAQRVRDSLRAAADAVAAETRARAREAHWFIVGGQDYNAGRPLHAGRARAFPSYAEGHRTAEQLAAVALEG